MKDQAVGYVSVNGEGDSGGGFHTTKGPLFD